MHHPAPHNDETTRRPPREEGRAEVSTTLLLTILSHPDPRRIGERAALSRLAPGKVEELGRHTPRFAPLGSPWNDRPLDDPFLSRKPWQIAATADGLELRRGRSSTRLRVEGEIVDEMATVDLADLDVGVTLELSDRVALLLQHMPGDLFTVAESRPAHGEMIGAGGGLLRVRSAIDRVAELDVPVLVRGESGTGKELVARALHGQSRRASKPFVAVDLGGLSPSLAASELFGHTKGAFTGASTAREGFFRAADGGTLFLDEVGEATPEVQALLLRVLETREVVPVGSHQPVPVDVRLVAATDADLEARSRRGDFKEPLLHRLAAYVISLPPLRERREDLGRLVVHLARPVLRELGEQHLLERSAGSGSPWLPADLAARLARETWTGNVRQLANVVRQLVIDSRGEGVLRADPELWARLAGFASAGVSGAQDTEAKDLPEEPTAGSSVPDEPDLSDSTDSERRRPSEVTDDELEQAMEAGDFEPATAARRLGISRASLYKLVRRHPTLRLAPDVPRDELGQVLAAVDGDVVDAALRLSVSKRALERRLTQLGLSRGQAG